MKIIRTLLGVVILLFAYSCIRQNNETSQNAIKLGTAKVVVNTLSLISDTISNIDTSDLDSLEIKIGTLSLFSGANEPTLTTLTRGEDNEGRTMFYGEIPLERIIENCSFQIYIKGYFYGGVIIRLNQENTTYAFLYLMDGSIDKIEFDNSTQPTPQEWWNVATVLRNADQTPLNFYLPTNTSLYDKSWKAVRVNQMDSVWPRYLEMAQKEVSIPESTKDWVTNNLKIKFATFAILPYSKLPIITVGKTVDEPPMEAYSFLDSINFSPEIFLLNSTYYNQFGLLRSILRFPCGGFEVIGETPVKEWQEKLSEWLAPAMKERPKLLLDLLAGTSYAMQIDDMKPLSDVQKKNIEEGFTDDIGKIVLKRNEKLETALSQEANLQDLSEKAFNLKEFIDTKYPGQPVVVDMWNTWCGPCLQAMTQTEEIKGVYEDTGLVFLYVSDVSSDLKEWENRARMIGGEQVRINEESKDALLDGYNLTGFPSYLFFDSDHNLIYAQTVFPGFDRYRALLNQITSK